MQVTNHKLNRTIGTSNISIIIIAFVGRGSETCAQVESFEQVGVLGADWEDIRGVVGVSERESGHLGEYFSQG